jgi:hypothetical protein
MAQCGLSFGQAVPHRSPVPELSVKFNLDDLQAGGLAADAGFAKVLTFIE